MTTYRLPAAVERYTTVDGRGGVRMTRAKHPSLDDDPVLAAIAHYSRGTATMNPFRKPYPRESVKESEVREPMSFPKFLTLVGGFVVSLTIAGSFATCAYTAKFPSSDERAIQKCAQSCEPFGMKAFAPSEQYKSVTCVCNERPAP
jgi:hypothetical protein